MKEIKRGFGDDNQSLKRRAESVETAFAGTRPQTLIAILEGMGRARFEVLGAIGGLLQSATFLLRINRWSVADDGTLQTPNGQFLMYVLNGQIIAFQDSNQAPEIPEEWSDEFPSYELFGTAT